MVICAASKRLARPLSDSPTTFMTLTLNLERSYPPTIRTFSWYCHWNLQQERSESRISELNSTNIMSCLLCIWFSEQFWTLLFLLYQLWRNHWSHNLFLPTWTCVIHFVDKADYYRNHVTRQAFRGKSTYLIQLTITFEMYYKNIFYIISAHSRVHNHADGSLHRTSVSRHVVVVEEIRLARFFYHYGFAGRRGPFR